MAQLVGSPGVGKAGPTSQTWTTPFPHRPGDKARDTDGNEYLFCSFPLAVGGSGIMVSIAPDHQASPLLATAQLTGRVGVACGTVAAAEGGWVQVYGLAVAQCAANGVSTDTASLAGTTGIGSAVVSDADVGVIWLTPQPAVTTPTGTLGLYGAGDVAVEGYTSLVSQTTQQPFGNVNVIYGAYLLTVADVSNIPDAYFTARYNTVTSPVSAVSNTSGPVTLTTRATSHHGHENLIFLNYPYLMGANTSTSAD